MDEERMTLARLEQLLKENYELAQENNTLLRDMRRMGRIGFWARVVLWAVIIVLPIIFLRPILNALVPVTGGTPDSGVNFFGLPSQEEFENLKRSLEEYRDTGGQ